MIKLELTKHQVDEILFATSQLYLDYLDDLGFEYNEATRRYNNTVDELRTSIKKQLAEQSDEKD